MLLLFWILIVPVARQEAKPNETNGKSQLDPICEKLIAQFRNTAADFNQRKQLGHDCGSN